MKSRQSDDVAQRGRPCDDNVMQAQFSALMVLAGCVVFGASSAAAPVAHEYIPPDPLRDAAVLRTLPGISSKTSDAPPGDLVYGGAASSGTFTIDADTRRPSAQQYDDPFTPTIAPFKRLRAFDALAADGSLHVASSAQRRLTVGGVATSSEDSFYAEFDADVQPQKPVAIPSPGPGARVLRLMTIPATDASISEDSAENWQLRARFAGRISVRMEIAVPRASFSNAVPAIEIVQLSGAAPPLPVGWADARSRLLGALPVPAHSDLRSMLGVLVPHFRGFTPTAQPLSSSTNLFWELLQSRAGVCRHRAYAFVVSSLLLGIPARLVTNEAHAWAEVFDGSLWRRIDLGGAVGELHVAQDERPEHRPPVDALAWPNGEEQGEAAVAIVRAAREREAQRAATESPPGAAGAEGDGADLHGGAILGNPDAPRSVVLAGAADVVDRGERFSVEGNVSYGGGPCAGVRVDTRLQPAAGGAPIVIGRYATDASGNFRGTAMVPPDASPGSYELTWFTPGAGDCPPGLGN